MTDLRRPKFCFDFRKIAAFIAVLLFAEVFHLFALGKCFENFLGALFNLRWLLTVRLKLGPCWRGCFCLYLPPRNRFRGFVRQASWRKANSCLAV